ncbi:MAG: RNA polymerase factor sigma-54, partial [Bacillota bacterium]|nr:RNA polymerase factor sigma-54 [Bacillota bacterium]
MDFSLVLQQTQKLIMTPELKQAIEILQFSALELGEFVSEELLNNPVLERMERPGEPHTAETPSAFAINDAQSETIRRILDSSEQRGIPISATDMDYDPPDAAVEQDLRTYLIEQLAFSQLEDHLQAPMHFLIESLDESGYLRCTAAELAQRFFLSDAEASQLIRTLQSFDPAGIGARDLKECLLIQLDARGFGESLESLLVRDHLDALASNRIAAIAKELDTSPSTIQTAFDRIRSLDPRPGALYASARDTRYISPDVTIERFQGEYSILVNESSAPRLVISGYYRDLFKSIETDKATTDYLAKKLQSALKLIKAIEQRRSTIYKVCRSILHHQADFFEHGVAYLKPLTLREVAEDIEMHESTVSRAVNGKYMQ